MSGNLPGPTNALLIQIPGYVFGVLCPVVVALRFISRLKSQASLGSDDWTILVSLMVSFGHTGVLLAACHFGFGKHIASLTPKNRELVLKFLYLSQIFYKISINLTKISILLLYLRLFVQKIFRTLCWLLISLILSYMIAATFATIFQCSSIPQAWNKSIAGTCINISYFWYANASISIATDCIVLLLPMPVISSLRLPGSQKIALMFVFALGAFVIVTSVLGTTKLGFSSKRSDSAYNIDSTSWNILECNLAIICACLPTFRVLLTRHFPTSFRSSTLRSSHNPGSFSYAGKATNDWAPTHSGKGHEHEIHLSNITTGPSRALASEEYILQGTEESKRGNWKLQSLKDEEREKVIKGEGIKLTTTYGIKYDDEESVMGHDDLVVQRISFDRSSRSSWTGVWNSDRRAYVLKELPRSSHMMAL